MKTAFIALAILTVATCSLKSANPAYGDPAGGWAYLFDGSSTALDGNWSHDNGSDAWDGSSIGSGSPGGVSALADDGDYLRLQEPGNPTQHGFPDPSNRKLYFARNITAEGGTATILNDGVTLYFRARIPTSGPLDQLHPDGGAIQPYPATGDGYELHNGGKGSLGIKQSAGGQISFALATGDGAGEGLVMNNLNGTAISGAVDAREGTANVITLDPTAWHDFWITIQNGGSGTHQANIYLDGDVVPTTFDLTAGDGSDYTGFSYLVIGLGGTPLSGAIDVDFFGFKPGVIVPSPFITTNSPPTIQTVSPANGTLFAPSLDGISFSASTVSPNSIAPADIQLTLNGSDVSASLAVSGTPTERAVSFPDLQPNRLYNASIRVADQEGRSSTFDWSFDTFDTASSTVIEAEDYNFDELGFCDPEFDGAFYIGPAGAFFDDPFPGSYRRLLGTPEIDFHDETDHLPTLTNINNVYRPCDAADLQVTSDAPRDGFALEGADDHEAYLLQTGDWMNYTRTFAAGNYHAYLRAEASFARVLQLSQVTSDRTQSGQSTFVLGSFQIPDTAGSYQYTQLTDPVGGTPVVFSLDGLNTLRLTAANANNDARANFLILAPTADPVTLAGPLVQDQLPADSATEVRSDTAIHATILNRATSVSPGSVQLLLNGSDVTTQATITPDALGASVDFQPPTLLSPGTVHILTLNYQDNLGNTYTDTWSFTTTSDVSAPSLRFAKAAFLSAFELIVTVTFSEPVAAAISLNSANYSIDNGVSLDSIVAGRDDRTVVITAGGSVVDGGIHTLTATLEDAVGNRGTSRIQFVVSSGIIVSVVETGGDAGVPAKFSGEIFDHPNLGLGYTVPRFQEDAAMYTDRNHQWNGATPELALLPYLVGCEYIMSQNNNRDNDLLQLDVTISALADVYLLIDNRLNDNNNATPPNFTSTNMQWVLNQGWIPVRNGLNRTGDNSRPDEVGADEGADGIGPGAGINQFVSIYSKKFPAGTFTLRQANNPGRNFYGVVVSPAIDLAPLQIEPAGPEVVLTWAGPGVLQMAPTLNGPWTDIAGASSPHLFTIVGTERFFRLRL